MQDQQLEQLMTQSADDAVKYAEEEFQLTLDYSTESLLKLDVLVSALHERQKKQAHATDLLFTLCTIFGAYTGEVFRRHLGGEWFHDKSNTEAPYVCLTYLDKEFPFSSIVYHKIITDGSISIAGYVEQAMSNATQ
ncbi:hypothetical protein Q3O60_06460 [Alkalimonas collagenimarina]|uniref:DUF3806 domain-containing protein n=1 Tax=Alkalimonas collagenimarina TaxID=400390 RepID=A0ABT9GXN6_9GAMM|nr:hypothetical protein [Alkalimonas collagenimarina]MDP4535822.1 hypothetical protein [Alkalimonas collagenimarina]